jgi:hypothetical protein
VPELSRFFGIIIRMFTEADAPHHLPHFHAYYQEHVAIYTVEPPELIGGGLPKRQQRFVEAWAELHREDLLSDWALLQQGKRPYPIKPLQ